MHYRSKVRHFFESLTIIFVILRSGRKYSHTNSYNFAMTLAPFAVCLRKMYIHLRQQLKLCGKYTFISTSRNFINAKELSITLFAYVLTFNSINGEQLHLWTIKQYKHTSNLAQWLIINTNRKSIAWYDNQLRSRDIQ